MTQYKRLELATQIKLLMQYKKMELETQNMLLTQYKPIVMSHTDQVTKVIQTIGIRNTDQVTDATTAAGTVTYHWVTLSQHEHSIQNSFYFWRAENNLSQNFIDERSEQFTGLEPWTSASLIMCSNPQSTFF